MKTVLHISADSRTDGAGEDQGGSQPAGRRAVSVTSSIRSTGRAGTPASRAALRRGPHRDRLWRATLRIALAHFLRQSPTSSPPVRMAVSALTSRPQAVGRRADRRRSRRTARHPYRQRLGRHRHQDHQRQARPRERYRGTRRAPKGCCPPRRGPRYAIETLAPGRSASKCCRSSPQKTSSHPTCGIRASDQRVRAGLWQRRVSTCSRRDARGRAARPIVLSILWRQPRSVCRAPRHRTRQGWRPSPAARRAARPRAAGDERLRRLCDGARRQAYGMACRGGAGRPSVLWAGPGHRRVDRRQRRRSLQCLIGGGGRRGIIIFANQLSMKSAIAGLQTAGAQPPPAPHHRACLHGHPDARRARETRKPPVARPPAPSDCALTAGIARCRACHDDGAIALLRRHARRPVIDQHRDDIGFIRPHRASPCARRTARC